MLFVLLIAGLWMAQFPESTLQRLRDLALGIQRFVDALLAPYVISHREPDPLTDSRGARIAMRCFGIAIAALAFAALAGLGR
jgi:hypothetical protein